MKIKKEEQEKHFILCGRSVCDDCVCVEIRVGVEVEFDDASHDGPLNLISIHHSQQ